MAARTRRNPLISAAVLAPVLVLVGVLAGCGTTSSDDGAGATATADALPLEDTSWGLVSYVDGAGGTVEVPDGVSATALFADGTVSGSGGCNRFSAPFQLEGDALTIGLAASTLMACPDPQSSVEAAYLAALDRTAGYQTDASSLTLLDDAGTALLTFDVIEPVALTGTEWTAVGINNGAEAIVSTQAGVTVTATFGSDGTVSGSAGCNTYSGSYTVDGDAIEIGPLASTQKACEPTDLMTQEAAFLAAMENATTYSIDGSILELRDDSGALQVDFSAG
jgi:heat shock protein HslJ